MAQATSDKQRSDGWIQTLTSAAAQLGAGEALAELGTQARELLSEVRRAAAEIPGFDEGLEGTAFTASPSSAASSAEDRQQAGPGLAGKLDTLSSSLEEVADLLDAGLERLETVEMQLGDPDASVDARLRAGIEGCERRLGGIEHRLRDLALAMQPAAARPALVALVVDADCRRRCDLCVALEHAGLRTLAAGDASASRRMLRDHRPDVVLARHELGDALLEAIVASFDDAQMPTAMVLAPWPQGRELATELARRFDGWQLATDAHGAHSLVEQIHSLRAVHAAQASPEQPAKEETNTDASV